MEAPRLFVVKKDGRREQYNRDKILSGLRRACEKRPVSDAQMEEIVASLEREMFARGESEVQSALIGEKLMEALKARRPGRLHPLRQRLPLVPRRRELPGRTGRTAEQVTMMVELKVLDERLRAWGLPCYQSAMARRRRPVRVHR